MSDTTLGVFLTGVFLLVLAVVFETPVAAGGAAVVLMVGLIYSYVVTKRELERESSYDIDLARLDPDSPALRSPRE